MSNASAAHAGLMLRLLSVFLMASMAAAVHGAAQDATIGQIMVWRSAFALVPVLIYASLKGDLINALRTRHPQKHMLRSLFGAASMAMSFVSLAYLPVANAQALAYLAPVFSLPVAAIALSETLSPRLIWAVAVGFFGALMLLWTSFELPGKGAFIGVLAGLGYAVTMAWVRVHMKRMMETETAASVAFYFAVVSTLVGLATFPFGWRALSPEAMALLVAAGILGGCGHIASAEALARAPVSKVATIDFTGLIWAVGFDVIIFAHSPDWLSILGMTAILGAAALTFKR